MNKTMKIALPIAGIVATLGIAFGVAYAFREQNVEGKLEDLMHQVYEGIDKKELPMMLGNVEITDENIENFLGSKDIDFKEALASESGVGSIAHSVVLIRANEDQDIEELKEAVEESANPAKWICVTAEEVEVENNGDLVILIMTEEEKADIISENFANLK